MEYIDTLSRTAEVIDIAARIKETISNAQYAVADSTNETEESENIEIDENIQQTLDSLISSNSGSNLAKIIAATTKIAKSTGALDLADDSIYNIASMGDEAALRIKTSYQVANGEIDIEEAAEMFIDRVSARLIVLAEYYIEHKLPLVADKMCDVICNYCPKAEPLRPIIKGTVKLLKPKVKNLVINGIKVISQMAKKTVPQIIKLAKSKVFSYADRVLNLI